MKYLNILILISFLLFSASASAEFYKYLDEDGNVRFTDDINQVPEAQRAKIRSYIESESQEPAAKAGTPENQAQESEQQQEVETDQPTNLPGLADDEQESLENARKRMEALKQEIDNEYKALIDEGKQLAEDRKKAKTNEQKLEFNKKVDSYNKRGESYQAKQKEYEAQVEAYNAMISEYNSKRKSQ